MLKLLFNYENKIFTHQAQYTIYVSPNKSQIKIIIQFMSQVNNT